MPRLKFALVALGTILLLVACTDNSSYRRLRPNDVILAFGNSLTFGTGAPEGQSYPDQLHKLTRRRIINAGIPGEITAEGRQRLPALLDEHTPDLLILCHGGNDMLRQLDRQQTIDNLRAMIEAARARQVPVMLVAVPQPGLLLSPAPFYRELGDQYGLLVDESIIRDTLTDRALKSDAIHPNAAGYDKMARHIADLLKEAGAL